MLWNQSKNTACIITECSLTSGITKWSRQENHLTSPPPSSVNCRLLRAMSSWVSKDGDPSASLGLHFPCFLFLFKQHSKRWICQQSSKSLQDSFSLNKLWKKTSLRKLYRNLSLTLAMSSASFTEREVRLVPCSNGPLLKEAPRKGLGETICSSEMSRVKSPEILHL